MTRMNDASESESMMKTQQKLVQTQNRLMKDV